MVMPAACKAVDAGSIPTSASKKRVGSAGGEIGRRNGLKIRWTWESVPVRVRLWVPLLGLIFQTLTSTLLFVK